MRDPYGTKSPLVRTVEAWQPRLCDQSVGLIGEDIQRASGRLIALHEGLSNLEQHRQAEQGVGERSGANRTDRLSAMGR